MQKPIKSYTEEELVILLKSKDARAYNLLYDNYSAALFGVISKVVSAEEIAEDILQDVFVKIWKNIENYDASKGRLFTWMLNIARNASIDYSRSKQSKMDGKLQDLENSRYEVNKQNALQSNTDFIGVKEQVAKLKEDYRVLIDMLYFEGYTQEDAAKELNIPLGTVKTRVRAAIVKLRETFK
ncbi:MAG TPA: sigma-70 family RNA polymerase sigma factor [Bacteroidia bacterium]|jgi:RNA polymerase sigma-70 factor (ECF subfamily)|nr:sigma-70 family RNA polymerase sigma factor [Bacteroidia bacterium]HRG51659.1 sigma-70 family RNA polymerase sigma factor [Bacteroidia bacterium]